MSAAAWAEVLATNLPPLVSQNYLPTSDDERGLWHACERLERDVMESDLILRAPDFHSYVVTVVERLLGASAQDLRIYLVRDPSFNASMAPNGMMLVHTGLLARVHDEAQLASVLGHEAGHYLRKHSVENWRNLRRKSAAVAFIGAGANAVAGYAALQGYDGQSWIDLANAINNAIVLSFFRFSRQQESEADAFGIGLLARAGYNTTSAAEVWQQLIAERKASAAARDKKYRDQSVAAFSTHPPSEVRLRDLMDTAINLNKDVVVSSGAETGSARWRRASQPYFASFIEEQIRLNDPGAGFYLIERHAQERWSGVLRYYQGEIYRLRGESGDSELAAEAYAAAVEHEDAPPEAWRAHGYSLMKLNRREDGRSALMRYLELQPDAPDAAMVRFSLSQ